MNSAGRELICPCGYENFERVVVKRRPGAPVVTDFVACVGCRTMYFVPLVRETAPPPHAIGTGGGPHCPSVPNTWGGIPPGHPARQETSEQNQAIKDAAARANKSKRRR